MMRVIFALMAVAVSVAMLGWIGLRDEKRLRSQAGAEAARKALNTRQRQLFALGAAVPGLVLMVSGWWSSLLLWIGVTVVLLWFWVLWLSRPSRMTPGMAEEVDAG